MGLCAWLLLPRYRRLAFRNVGIAFGAEKSSREMRRLVRRHFQRLGANLLCTVKLMRMSPEEILKSVTVENIESMAR
jgi:lauroyl/myristoyl acyltransferase